MIVLMQRWQRCNATFNQQHAVSLSEKGRFSHRDMPFRYQRYYVSLPTSLLLVLGLLVPHGPSAPSLRFIPNLGIFISLPREN